MGFFATPATGADSVHLYTDCDADYREDDTEQACQFQALVSQHHGTGSGHFRIQRRAHPTLTRLEAASWPSENTSTETISPKPIIWTAKATDILEKVTRTRAVTNKWTSVWPNTLARALFDRGMAYPSEVAALPRVRLDILTTKNASECE
jgi:hypothetical protein